MYLSDLVTALEGSATAEIFAEAKKLEKQGKKVYHLEIGQPDFLPPQPVLDAICEATKQGKTTYTPSRGMIELREEIAKYLLDTTGATVGPENEIIAITGAKHGLFSSMFTVLNPGDEVLLPNPCWVSYEAIVRSVRAKPIFINLNPPHFDLDADLIHEHITANTKVIVINSPNNPTGTIYSEKQIHDTLKLAKDLGIYVMSDEIYSEYVFDSSWTSLLSFPEWREIGIVINGFSKSFSMTGLRLAWIAANSKIIDQINKVIQFTTSCPPSISQWGGIAALKHVDLAREQIAKTIPQRIKAVFDILGDLETIQLTPIEGAMYAFLRIGDGNSVDDIEIAKQLLSKEGIAITPGSAFGPAGKGHLRISLGVKLEELTVALDKLKRFLSNI